MQTISMKKRMYGWLLAVIVLSVLLILSIGLGFSGYFFSISMSQSPTDVVLGDTVLVEVKPNQTGVVSFTIDGSYLPKERLPQVVQIKLKELESEVRVRVKAEILKSDGVGSLNFQTTENFIEASDGYYYFDGTLTGGSKVTFCNHIVIPEDAKFLSKDRYILTIVVENLETKYDANEIWNVRKAVENFEF